MENSEQPAYPISEDILRICGEKTSPFGLTKREYFAGLAMQAIISCRDKELLGSEVVSMKAVAYADELLKQLEE